MEKSSAAAHPFTLRRVHQDSTEEQVGTFPSFEQGWSAGQHAVHADRENAYSLYRGGRRVARFGFNRIAISSKSFDWSVLS